MKKNQLDALKELRKRSEEYRNSLYSEADFDMYESYWRGEYPGVGDDILPVPTLTSNAKRQMSSLFGGTPRVVISANDFESLPSARVATEYINMLIRETNLLEELKDAGQDAITNGSGFLVDGFGSEYGTSKEALFSGFEPTRTDAEGLRQLEYKENVKSNMPWTLRVHPADILLPPDTIRCRYAYGFFHRCVRHIDEVRADEKYITKHRLKIKPDTHYDYTREKHDTSTAKNDYLTLWTWHDLRTTKVVVFNENYDFALLDNTDEIMYRTERCQLHDIIFNPIPRMCYGASDFHLMANLAREVNDIRTMQMRQRRIQIFKGVYNRTMLEGLEDYEQIKKAIKGLTSDEVGALIGIDGDPNQFLKGIQPGQAMDMLPSLDLAKKEIEEYGLNVGPRQKGQMESGRHTAYETQVAEGHYQRTIYPRMQAVQKSVLKIAENWLQLLKDFIIEPIAIRTYDAAGMPVLVQFTGLDLTGDFRFDISMESMQSMSKEDKIREANMILSQSMPFVQGGIANPEMLYRQWLSRVASEDWQLEALCARPLGTGPGPVPFGQYQDTFRKQVPQNTNSIAAMMQNQNMFGGQGKAG